ncbi:ATP-binding protein [Kitasatospora cathayae]|uniref:ATP-binding protein n=1 Tax=Kitasatospora cathayae TaxID=3004092 RepID=A0ABY7Q2J0_9ACTN|nr:ATP-binding protein [Kitasatospora sp. HUAS 3-15]WBP86908.1 ATP-binding protein [Kitasatospora sp. HUAS 3-15]
MITQPVDAVEWMLPRHPRSASRARIRLLRQAFDWQIDVESAETALILLSELVTNACRHARSPRDRMIGVRVLLPTSSLLRIEVSDANPELPTLRHATPDDESGRGLELVAALATSWGAHPRGEGYIGKTAWCELALPTPANPHD